MLPAPQVEYSGGGVGRTAWRGGVGTDILLGIGGLQRVRRVGDEDRTVGSRAQDQRACGKVDVAAAVDVAELAAAGHVEPEVGVALRDAGDLLAKPVDAEDIAEEIQVRTCGIVDQRLSKIEELVGLHRAELVANNVAEGARLAARGGLLDARLGERRQDIQLVERHGLWGPPRQDAGSSTPIAS